MKTKTIKQTVTFAATPEKIYHLIMDSKKHSAFTGSKVTMSTKVNGKFSVFDGYCHGYNINFSLFIRFSPLTNSETSLKFGHIY